MDSKKVWVKMKEKKKEKKENTEKLIQKISVHL